MNVEVWFRMQMVAWLILFSVHCSVQLKPFCGIPPITLNNWDEGRENQSPNYAENCYVAHLGRTNNRPLSPGYSMKPQLGYFQKARAGGHQLFCALNHSLWSLNRSWSHVLSLSDWAWALSSSCNAHVPSPKQFELGQTTCSKIPSSWNLPWPWSTPETNWLKGRVSGRHQGLPSAQHIPFISKVCPGLWRGLGAFLYTCY